MVGPLAECVDPHSGQIYVNKYLQVTNTNPLALQQSELSEVYSNIFCIGDVSLTPADEEKAILPIHIQTSVLVRNLRILINENHNASLIEMPDTFPRVYFINFGN